MAAVILTENPFAKTLIFTWKILKSLRKAPWRQDLVILVMFPSIIKYLGNSKTWVVRCCLPLEISFFSRQQQLHHPKVVQETTEHSLIWKVIHQLRWKCHWSFLHGLSGTFQCSSSLDTELHRGTRFGTSNVTARFSQSSLHMLMVNG